MGGWVVGKRGKNCPGVYCMCMHIHFQIVLENRIINGVSVTRNSVSRFFCVEDAYNRLHSL